jgi:hypothetical protein
VETPALRTSIREAYRSLRIPVPDLSQAKFFNNALLHGKIRVNIDASERATRKSEVRLRTRQRRDSEWATVLCLFETSDMMQWAYVQPYSFDFLCDVTGAPVVVQDQGAIVVPLDSIAHPVLIVPFPLRSHRNVEDGVQRYWVCWWTATGPLKYNQEARFKFLHENSLLPRR